MTSVFSGREIATYIIGLTSAEDMVVESWLIQYVIPNSWELKTVSLEQILKDPAFKEFWENIKSEEDLRYDEEFEELTFEDYVQPVVLYEDRQETLLIDGYSRSARHLWNGEKQIKAYVNKGAN